MKKQDRARGGKHVRFLNDSDERAKPAPTQVFDVASEWEGLAGRNWVVHSIHVDPVEEGETVTMAIVYFEPEAVEKEKSYRRITIEEILKLQEIQKLRSTGDYIQEKQEKRQQRHSRTTYHQKVAPIFAELPGAIEAASVDNPKKIQEPVTQEFRKNIGEWRKTSYLRYLSTEPQMPPLKAMAEGFLTAEAEGYWSIERWNDLFMERKKALAKSQQELATLQGESISNTATKEPYMDIATIVAVKQATLKEAETALKELEVQYRFQQSYTAVATPEPASPSSDAFKKDLPKISILIPAIKSPPAFASAPSPADSKKLSFRENEENRRKGGEISGNKRPAATDVDDNYWVASAKAAKSIPPGRE